ncbi:MAG: serine hydrolase [Candidatus Hydrogenedentes bacterium]|nr:serine hydrolase [Candidatus Hydrogenedentota bacterium]
MSSFRQGCVIALIVSGAMTTPAHSEAVWPDDQWAQRDPADAGLDPAVLQDVATYLGGRGCVVRAGYLVYAWGDVAKRGDVASAVKPWFSTLLFLAVESGRLESLDTPMASFEPRLTEINPDLDHKDRGITFRHAANQTSCYGVREKPGAAFDYNDWQMALFSSTLIEKIYGATWDTADRVVLGPLLADILECEDAPTLIAFGPEGRRGRLGISPRDFARFGLLYLRGGAWRGQPVLTPEHARMAVSSPLPPDLPRTSGELAEMIPGQTSLGSERIPDNQTDHFGSYSWLWWVNGVDRDGKRMWPDAPLDVFCALGHKNGQRGIAVIPSLDLVLSWNDTTLGDRPEQPHPLNAVFRMLGRAAQ